MICDIGLIVTDDEQVGNLTLFMPWLLHGLDFFKSNLKWETNYKVNKSFISSLLMNLDFPIRYSENFEHFEFLYSNDIGDF